MTSEADTVYDSPRPERVAAEDSWWGRYFTSTAGLSDTAREVLDIDCQYIVDRGVFGDGEPGPQWPSGRVRRGLVMGSVQSGKTASMLGVAARSLDRGVDIVVVLAGTRLSLWQQTMERLEAQLDADTHDASRQQRRLLVPSVPPSDSLAPAERYSMARARVRRVLRKRTPIIVVALKHPRHIQEVRGELERTVFPEAAVQGRPVHMLVIDDEADDGSILDSVVESGMAPGSAHLKQIPRVIADLWAPPGRTAPENFYSTYIGYTATPHANFLQDEANPLFPRDFVVALRTPLDRGVIDPRSSTYTEPRGLPRFYTGGEVYYRRGQSAALCERTGSSPDADTFAAVRAFLVATAIRVHRAADRLSPATSAREDFASREDALERASAPYGMLVHPSALTGDQFATAAAILQWAGATNLAKARSQVEDPEHRAGLPAAELAAKINAEEPLWSQWVESYRASAQALHREFNTAAAPAIPDWPTVKKILVEEVIPATRVSVVNSDEAADDRPHYEPTPNGDGSWSAGRDLSTIFVSGNVMSRGLTLEGLSTTVFFRRSDRPLADTQMQMQRWFGYRGSYIELCRVFADQQQLELFAQYHETDTAIRTVIAENMSRDTHAPTPIVLHGDRFDATGKIAKITTVPLYRGRRPFIDFPNSGQAPDPNADLVHDLFAGAAFSKVIDGAREVGLTLDQPLTLDVAAAVLDRLTFDHYRPGTSTWQSALWRQLQDRLNAVHPFPAGTDLYRPPLLPAGADPDPGRSACPYWLAAYLRLWDACLIRKVDGLFDTGARNARWALTDLRTKAAQQPRFWVGVRYGAGPVAAGALAPLQIRTTAKKLIASGTIDGTWGSNNPAAVGAQWRGDEFFDYFHRGLTPPPARAGGEIFRPAGADGQILFYVNQPEGQPHPSIAVGICVPLGGPDQFAAFV